MSKVFETAGEAVNCAWSPFSTTKNILATASRASDVAEDASSASLRLYDVMAEDTASQLLGKVPLKEATTAIAWGKASQLGQGLISVGDRQGNISLLNPAGILEKKNSIVATYKKHTRSVLALDFCTISKGYHFMVSGGTNNEILVSDLKNLEKPSIFTPNSKVKQDPSMESVETSCVAWNSQVVHVVASGSSSGVVSVWDLRQKTTWCTLKDTAGAGYTSIKWNPHQGLHLMTATESSDSPVLRLYDLRKNSGAPLMEFHGHTDSVLDISYCSFDDMVVASTAKDKSTIIWDLYSGKPVMSICESNSRDRARTRDTAFSVADPGSSGLAGLGANGDFADAGDVFNRTSSEAFKKSSVEKSENCFFCGFSPELKCALATSTFNGNLSVYSVASLKNANFSLPDVSIRVPKWSKGKFQVDAGYGGKILEVPKSEKGKTAVITVAEENVEGSMLNALKLFLDGLQPLMDGSIAPNDFLAQKISSLSAEDRNLVTFYKCLSTLFNVESDSLLTFLEINKAEIENEVLKYAGLPTKYDGVEEPKVHISQETKTAAGLGGMQALDIDGGEASNFFGQGLSLDSNTAAQASTESETKGHELKSPKKVEKKLICEIYQNEEVDRMVGKSLLVGNFDAAAYSLAKNESFAEALLFASMAGEATWKQVVDNFLSSRMAQSRPYINLMKGVLNQDLAAFVENKNNFSWKEEIAVIKLYAQEKDVSGLIQSLGNKYLQKNDYEAAFCCFFLANDVEGLTGLLKTSGCSEIQIFEFSCILDALQRSSETLVLEDSAFSSTSAVLLTVKLALVAAEAGEQLVAAQILSFVELTGEEEHLSSPAKEAIKVIWMTRDRIYNSIPDPSVVSAFIPEPWFPYEVLALNDVPVVDKRQVDMGQVGGDDDDAAPLPEDNGIYTNNGIGENLGYQNDMPGAGAGPSFGSAGNPQSIYETPAPRQVSAPAPSAFPTPASSFAMAAKPVVSGKPPKAASPKIPVNDGFGTTAGNPVAGRKYGNLTKSQPFEKPHGVESPFESATANVAETAAVPQAPKASAQIQVSTEMAEALDMFRQVKSALLEESLTPSEQRNITTATKAVDVLESKLKTGQVGLEVQLELQKLAQMLGDYDFTGADQIRLMLTRNFWTQHKDWIKGLGHLIQLSNKKWAE